MLNQDVLEEKMKMTKCQCEASQIARGTSGSLVYVYAQGQCIDGANRTRVKTLEYVGLG